MKTKYIVLKESFVQSVLSDIVTFGLLSFCIWFSQDSRFWSVVAFFMFFFFIISAATKKAKDSYCMSPEELIEYANKLIAERDSESSE